MLSPDPVTQAPENGQNYDRYTYAFNNPLKYTDPSGYQVEDLIVDESDLNRYPGSDDGDGRGSVRFTKGGFASHYNKGGSTRSEALNAPGGYTLQSYEDRLPPKQGELTLGAPPGMEGVSFPAPGDNGNSDVVADASDTFIFRSVKEEVRPVIVDGKQVVVRAAAQGASSSISQTAPLVGGPAGLVVSVEVEVTFDVITDHVLFEVYEATAVYSVVSGDSVFDTESDLVSMGEFVPTGRISVVDTGLNSSIDLGSARVSRVCFSSCAFQDSVGKWEDY